MAQNYGQVIVPGQSNRWEPLSALKVGNEFHLKTSTIIVGSVVITGNVGVILGVPKHYNGTVGLVPATVAFAVVTKSLVIENLHATNDLFVSFDAGVNTFKISKLSSIKIEAGVTSLDISASAITTAYQILTVE